MIRDERSVNVDLIDDDGIITESGTDSLQEQADDVHTFARMRYSERKGALTERTTTSLFRRAYYKLAFPIMIIYFW